MQVYIHNLSIHALLAESDLIANRLPVAGLLLSIHALLAESDATASRAERSRQPHFLSTLSLRRATHPNTMHAISRQTFYPRSPCGERREHTTPPPGAWTFYPRSPCGERPNMTTYEFNNGMLSIHALLAESDAPGAAIGHRLRPFYPRSPCGERLHLFASSGVDFTLSIHALLAESDNPKIRLSLTIMLSIHALLAESDLINTYHRIFGDGFYPRSPCGERLNSSYAALDGASVSIHALLAESDERADSLAHTPPEVSIHALLAESDQLPAPKPPRVVRFLSTLSLRRAT